MGRLPAGQCQTYYSGDRMSFLRCGAAAGGLGICLSSFCAAPETPCSMWEPAQIFWRKVRERHGPSGLFVSTGAVGIFAGALVPLSEGGRILAGCILILLCALLFLVCRRCHGTGMHGNSAEHAAVLPRDRGGLTGGFFLPAACLVLVVVLRSFDGLLFSFDWNDGQRTGVLLTCMIFLGKCLGGFAADWMGSLWASVCSLGAAAVLLAFSGFPAAGLSGVLFFNMTMPVTLYELYRRTSREFRRRVRTAYLCTVPGISACLYRNDRGDEASAVLFCVCSDLPVPSRICSQKKAGKEDSGLKEEEVGWL